MIRLPTWAGGRAGDLAVLLAGAALPLAFAPFGLYPLAVLSLLVMLLGWQDVTPRRAFRRGWLFGLGYFGVGVNWVHVSIHEYGDASLAASLTAAFALVAFISLYPALLGYLANRVGPARGALRWLVFLPSGWLLIEWLRGWVLTGFPWLSVGYSQVDGPLAGLAPLVGVYGIGWTVVFSAGLLAYAWEQRSRDLAWILSGASVLLLWAVAAVLDTQTWTQPAGRSFKASVLQGNISQDLKWAPEHRVATVEVYTRLTRESQGSRVVVWPETAIPAFHHQVEEVLLPQLQEAAEEWNLDLVTGIPVLDLDKWEYFNAVMTLGSQQGGFYYKRHLVPFGEYMPLRPLLESFLSAIDLAMADFSSGADEQPLLQAGGYGFGASVCFEILFGEEINRALPGAAYLVNVSNDAWFGDSLAAHQHLEIARMRARETERYVLRATNTGISAFIDHFGRVQSRTAQFEVAALTDRVQPRQGATPYVRMGDGPLLLIALLLCCLAVWRGNPPARKWIQARLERLPLGRRQS